ncbi:nitrogenase-stabilizing/protective protein NifW [Martelella endophytica]|uniref:Nitrogenase-stabilizing/protective protein NifW n=1 Tax=Martelella endophytica TaxID=1486262 RepID=A0A0D5LXT2_MAREN|nr:nitrogenase-stabilizing/protective protein NifW [Martelella endophytica]AJY48268.1 hypothetical protein TM49_15535 [Martelella endophytica]
MRNDTLEEELAELNSAEEFFQFFGIETDPAVVFVNRLHILQRFHDYLEKEDAGPADSESWNAFYARHLQRAYSDFVSSDAHTEKVFKVFHHQPQRRPAFVPLTSIVKKI